MTAISGVEFLIWLLIAASTIAVLTKYLRIPYTADSQCSQDLVLPGITLERGIMAGLPMTGPKRKIAASNGLTATRTIECRC